MKRRYIFTLEIAPLEVGKVYDNLPSHLTLMSRFWTELTPAQVTELPRAIIHTVHPLELTFGPTVELGPKKVIAHLVEQPKEQELHKKLHMLLSAIPVEFEYPHFVGEGHKPHVTYRKDVQFRAGDTHLSRAVYLVEIVDKKRVVRSKFGLT
jgi:hypothetical protein